MDADEFMECLDEASSWYNLACCLTLVYGVGLLKARRGPLEQTLGEDRVLLRICDRLRELELVHLHEVDSAIEHWHQHGRFLPLSPDAELFLTARMDAALMWSEDMHSGAFPPTPVEFPQGKTRDIVAWLLTSYWERGGRRRWARAYILQSVDPPEPPPPHE